MDWINWNSLVVWIHVFVGIIWIGLLYYFNFIQMPAVAKATADKEKSDKNPGPAAINKYVAPQALFWFRWAALLTWITGAIALQLLFGSRGGLHAAFALQHDDLVVIGIGAWLGTIMLFNVWVLIWPNQKKVLGLCDVMATDEQKAKAKKIAMLASRTNTLLSIPMLMCMVGGGIGHGLPFTF